MKQEIADLLISPKGNLLNYCQKGENEFLQNSLGETFFINDGIICFIDNNSLTGNNRKYQRIYDRFSGFYDIVTKIYAKLKNGNEEKRLVQYLSLLNIKDEDKVIEISIGTGRNIKYLNTKADYYGVDISLGMLKQCNKRMKKLNRKITLIQAEAESLPVKNETFDIVFSAGGFNFFNNPGKAVNEMLRIAKPGTKLLITDETEKVRLKYQKSTWYKNDVIKNPVEYLPTYCKNIDYKEICDGDLYVLTFYKP